MTASSKRDVGMVRNNRRLSFLCIVLPQTKRSVYQRQNRFLSVVATHVPRTALRPAGNSPKCTIQTQAAEVVVICKGGSSSSKMPGSRQGVVLNGYALTI